MPSADSSPGFQGHARRIREKTNVLNDRVYAVPSARWQKLGPVLAGSGVALRTRHACVRHSLELVRTAQADVQRSK
jgi:hypothetical protein